MSTEYQVSSSKILDRSTDTSDNTFNPASGYGAGKYARNDSMNVYGGQGHDRFYGGSGHD